MSAFKSHPMPEVFNPARIIVEMNVIGRGDSVAEFKAGVKIGELADQIHRLVKDGIIKSAKIFSEDQVGNIVEIYSYGSDDKPKPGIYALFNMLDNSIHGHESYGDGFAQIFFEQKSDPGSISLDVFCSRWGLFYVKVDQVSDFVIA